MAEVNIQVTNRLPLLFYSYGTRTHLILNSYSYHSHPALPNAQTIDVCGILGMYKTYSNSRYYNTYFNVFRNHANLVSISNFSQTHLVNFGFALFNCPNLTTVHNLPKYILNGNMDSSFARCISLTNLPEIPNSVTSLTNTFSNCSNLTSVVIPEGIKHLTNTFNNCSNLTSAVIPYGVETMYSTFANCTALTVAPVIPSSVVTLMYTFSNCTSLSVGIYDVKNVTNLYHLYSGCSNLDLTTVGLSNSENANHFGIFAGTNFTSQQLQGLNLSNIKNAYGLFAYGNSSNFTGVVIPNSVTDMSSCFYATNYVNGATITIPNSVINMKYCFGYCHNFISPQVIPNSVVDLSYCFYDCVDMTSAPVIPDSVTNMRSAFYWCWNLTSIGKISNSVVDLSNTFNGCNLSGNIYIYSNQVQTASDCFDGSTTKNVYIPFTYENGEYTKTYNSFTAAGYTTTGSQNGVYLKDTGTH